MNRKTSITWRLAGATLAVAVALAGCTQATDSKKTTTTSTSGNSVLPDKVAVAVPASVKGSTAKGISRAPTSIYDSLKSMVSSGTSSTGAIAQYLVIADAVISQNNVSLDSQPGAQTLTLTQALYDRMKSSVEETGLEMDTSSGPKVGDTQTFSSFEYATVTGDADYNYKVVMTAEGISVSIYWNTAKTKVKTTFGDVVTITYDGSDSSNVKSITSFSAGGTTYGFELVASGSAAYLAVYSVSGSTKSYQFVGYADDNGGGVKYWATASSDTSSEATSFIFDNTGAELTSGTAFDTYNTKLTDATSKI